MKFANLVWAIADRKAAHYETAAAASMSESAFSRALNGRQTFSTHQRAKIADFLGYPETWLFALITPPRRRARRSEQKALYTASADG
jgi:hypothetical protein